MNREDFTVVNYPHSLWCTHIPYKLLKLLEKLNNWVPRYANPKTECSFRHSLCYFNKFIVSETRTDCAIHPFFGLKQKRTAERKTRFRFPFIQNNFMAFRAVAISYIIQNRFYLSELLSKVKTIVRRLRFLPNFHFFIQKINPFELEN